MGAPNKKLDRLLTKTVDGEPLAAEDLLYLLRRRRPADVQALFAAARYLTERHFGRRVFLYGFVYFSTHCRNRCRFCYYRQPNTRSPRYRKTAGEVLAISQQLKESGVHLLDLTMGEDPFIYGGGFDYLVDLVALIKDRVGLPVMVSPGVVPGKVLRELQRAGADWYACYQETHNRALYSFLRPRQDYDERMAAKRTAAEIGLLVEEGILLGVGESARDRVVSLLSMKRLGARQVRVMSFVPQAGTPMEDRVSPSRLVEMVTIAVMRLALPDRLIPASLDVDGIRGLHDRLLAGANVVTSIIPPSAGLAGVSRSTLDIEDGFRTVAGVSLELERAGLEMASCREYGEWLSRDRAAAVPENHTGRLARGEG